MVMTPDISRLCTACLWIGVRVPATHVLGYSFGNSTRELESFGCKACASKWAWGLPRNAIEACDHVSETEVGGVFNVTPLAVWLDCYALVYAINDIMEARYRELRDAQDAIARMRGADLG